MVISRKIKLIPISLRYNENKDIIKIAKKEIKNACYAQAIIMNTYMSMRYSNEMIKGIKYFKDIIDDDFIKEVTNSCMRIPGSKKGSTLDNELYVPFGGYQTMTIKKIVNSAYKKSKKEGLLTGKVSLPSFKDDSPFYLHKNHIGLEHGYENFDEFIKALYTKNKSLELYLNYGNKGKPTLARFKVVLGSLKKSKEIRNVIERIFTNEYKICGSSIQLDDNDIIINLSIDIPETNHKLDQNVIVGVDLGMKIPAVCALNTLDIIKQYIGDGNDFQKQKDGYKTRKRILQKGIRQNSGGHGRTKKLKALERLKHREKNWTRTYNHQISKNIVDFAIKNNAGTIKMEDLSGIKRSNINKDKILGDWTYYQIQQQVKYKANKHGIKVVMIDPRNTSITCSCCGNIDKNQRNSQADFSCNNPDCKMFGKTINADFNSARNISLSEKVIKE